MKNSNFLMFNSISELMGELDRAPLIPDRYTSSEDADRGGDWCDTSSWQEAHDAMIAGRMYNGLSGDLAKYRTKGSKEKSRTYNSVVGHNVIVPLYLQGVPTCMVNSKRTINNKIVTIIYKDDVPCDVNQDVIIKNATELMRNIIQLEQDGYRVNLYVMGYNNNYDGFGFLLKLKTDRETLNIKKLCFPLVSSSFLRRIDFRIKERLYKDWIGGGYGNAHANKRDIENFIYKMLKLKHYEVWDYRGKMFTK